MWFFNKKLKDKKDPFGYQEDKEKKEGRELLSSEVLAKIQRLQLKAGWKVTDSLLGKYSSAFRGSGMEFEKLREYVVGDDVRNIDWKVTARMQKAFVREYREERQMSVHENDFIKLVPII